MWKSYSQILWIGSFCAFLACNGACWGTSADFMRGYAQCIIDDMLPTDGVEVEITDAGLTLWVQGDPLPKELEQRITQRFKNKESTLQVRFVYVKPISEPSLQTAPVSRPVLAAAECEAWEFLPLESLYDAPVADPRWPKFKVGYQFHKHQKLGKRFFSLAFGENLPLAQYKVNEHSWELGVQAGLFGLMDVTQDPTALINSDYFVGVGLSYAYKKKWQNLIQFSHLSSHIGDELLVKNKALIAQRINLSYETLKWLTAYKFDTFRPYAGVGYIVHRDPSQLLPFVFEYGCDYTSPYRFFNNLTRVVAGVHLQHWEEVNYQPAINISAGLQLENPVWHNRFLRFLLEYYNGNARDGQFYKFKQQYIGISLSLTN